MDWLPVLQAFLLGIVEGLTEFLPVSSTGHLIVVGDAIGFVGEREDTFKIFIQLGAILGVVWHYRAKVLDVALNLQRPPERRLAANLLIAFMPAAVLGLLAHKTIKTYLFSPVTVAAALIAGGFAILAIERWHKRRQPRVLRLEDLSYTDSLKVGMAQTLAMFPGVSRAGATIMGGLVSGLSRTAATEFSFFLAMPTMLAATLYDLYKNWHLLRADDLLIFGAGFATAFATALIVVKVFLVYVSRHTFRPFAWYRIGLGVVVLGYFVWRAGSISAPLG